jgi:hypothetical protein
VTARGEGSVFHYPYLWINLAERGVEQPKDRVTTIALAARKQQADDGATVVHMLLLGITDNPHADQAVVAIPVMEKRRAGLDPNRAAFVVISEYNYDVWPGSHDYNPRSKTYGHFSAAFVEELKRRLRMEIQDRSARRIDRITGQQ